MSLFPRECSICSKPLLSSKIVVQFCRECSAREPSDDIDDEDPWECEREQND